MFASMSCVPLSRMQVKTVNFAQWRRIEAAEVEAGKVRGKAAEKIADTRKMLEIAHAGA